MFSQIDEINKIDTTNAQGILLPNWAYPGKLPKAQGDYIYDLSERALLDDENVVNVLQQCQHVIVPTKTLASIVKPFCGSVAVIPSMVHAEWFFGTPQPKSTTPLVACIGNFEWDLILEPLLLALKQHPTVRVVTTNPALYRELPEARRAFVETDVQTFPRIIRSCYLCLVPGERQEHDPGIIHEFNLYGTPAIVGPAWKAEIEDGRTGFVASSKQQFLDAFRSVTTDDRLRARMGNAAQLSAREYTAKRRADSWLISVEKLCPTSVAPFTIK